MTTLRLSSVSPSYGMTQPLVRSSASQHGDREPAGHWIPTQPRTYAPTRDAAFITTRGQRTMHIHGQPSLPYATTTSHGYMSHDNGTGSEVHVYGTHRALPSLPINSSSHAPIVKGALPLCHHITDHVYDTRHIGGSRSYVGTNRHINHLLASTHAANNLNRSLTARALRSSSLSSSSSSSTESRGLSSGSLTARMSDLRDVPSSSSWGGESEADYRYRTRRVNNWSVQDPRIVHVPTGAPHHVTLQLRATASSSTARAIPSL